MNEGEKMKNELDWILKEERVEEEMRGEGEDETKRRKRRKPRLDRLDEIKAAQATYDAKWDWMKARHEEFLHQNTN